MSAVAGLPNVDVNQHPSAQRLGVQRPKGAGLNMLLGRLAKPNTRSTERTTRKAYHLRLMERDTRDACLLAFADVHTIAVLSKLRS